MPAASCKFRWWMSPCPCPVILSAMEAALGRNASEYSRYGSPVHKQVYLYGGLDTSPTTFRRNFGMAWGMGGWLLFPFLNKIGAAGAEALKQRVARELRSTFRSHYAGELSLPQAPAPDQALAPTGCRGPAGRRPAGGIDCCWAGSPSGPLSR